MKFGRIVLNVITHRLTELNFCFDVIISRWRLWLNYSAVDWPTGRVF